MLVENAQLGYERVARENYAFMWDDPILQWIAVCTLLGRYTILQNS